MFKITARQNIEKINLSSYCLIFYFIFKLTASHLEPFQASINQVRIKNNLKPLNLESIDGFLFCYNAQRRATMGLMETSLQQLLAYKSASFKTRPGLIISSTSDPKEQISTADTKTKKMFIKGFKIAQKLRWDYIVSGNINVSRENVLTAYGDFLDKISSSKINRNRRNDEVDWPAPVSLKDLSLKEKNISDSGTLSLRGSGAVINSSEQNIIDLIINKNVQDKKFSMKNENVTPKRAAPPVPNRRPTTLQTITSNSNLKTSRRSTSPIISQQNIGTENDARTPPPPSSSNRLLNSSRSAVNSSFLVQTSEYFNRQLTSCIQTLQNLLPLFTQRCTEHIEIHGKNFEGLYRIPANARERKELVQQFDQNPYLDLTKFSINTICGAVTWFYSEKNLKHPVVSPNLAKQLANTLGISPPMTKNIWKTEESSLEVCNEIRKIIVNAVSRSLNQSGKTNKHSASLAGGNELLNDYFPPAHYKSLKHMFLHLSRLVHFQDKTKMGIANLAMVFSPCLFWLGGINTGSKDMPSIEHLKSIKNSQSIIEKILELAIERKELFDIIFPDELSYDSDAGVLDIRNKRLSNSTYGTASSLDFSSTKVPKE